MFYCLYCIIGTFYLSLRSGRLSKNLNQILMNCNVYYHHSCFHIVRGMNGMNDASTEKSIWFLWDRLSTDKNNKYIWTQTAIDISLCDTSSLAEYCIEEWKTGFHYCLFLILDKICLHSQPNFMSLMGNLPTIAFFSFGLKALHEEWIGPLYFSEQICLDINNFIYIMLNSIMLTFVWISTPK